MIRVLLVEDDKNLCFILKSSLEQMIGGYEVTTAPNGRVTSFTVAFPALSYAIKL